jgi:discoidin domain receptor family protein 2
MRLELYGCVYQGLNDCFRSKINRLIVYLDGLISYSIPQGDKLGYDAQFYDEIYDGNNENGILIDGLGQLTDGIIGQDDYRLTDNDQIGYDWIGWKRSTVNLIFHFDTFRNFTSIRFHTSNFFSHEIYLIHSIIIAHCGNSNQHQIDFLVPDDYTNSSARFIQLSFGDKRSFSSNCLNITLIANNQSQWILISEIQFNSIPTDSLNVTGIFPPKNSISFIQKYLFR